MLKWILGTALAVSLLGVAAYDLLQQRVVEDRERQVIAKRTELKPLAAMVAEVEAYQKQKDKLQLRIDLINQIKQHQSRASNAVAALVSIDSRPTPIETIAVDPTVTIVNGRARSADEIDALAKQIGAKEKRERADLSFMLKVTR